MLAIAHADIEGFSKEREGLRAQIRQLKVSTPFMRIWRLNFNFSFIMKEKQNETVRMSMSDSSMVINCFLFVILYLPLLTCLLPQSCHRRNR